MTFIKGHFSKEKAVTEKTSPIGWENEKPLFVQIFLCSSFLRGIFSTPFFLGKMHTSYYKKKRICTLNASLSKKPFKHATNNLWWLQLFFLAWNMVCEGFFLCSTAAENCFVKKITFLTENAIKMLKGWRRVQYFKAFLSYYSRILLLYYRCSTVCRICSVVLNCVTLWYVNHYVILL